MNEEELNELKKYANLSQDEYGEFVWALIILFELFKYGINDNLKNSIEQELKWILNDFKNTTTIVTKSNTVTNTWEELEYN